MKSEKPVTLLEIRRAGLEALARELGPVGMIRFPQQYETGHGDYSVERHQWVDQVNLDTIVEEIRQQEESSE